MEVAFTWWVKASMLDAVTYEQLFLISMQQEWVSEWVRDMIEMTTFFSNIVDYKLLPYSCMLSLTNWQTRRKASL